VGRHASARDFQAALREYNAGHYELAHAHFLALAELGDCSRSSTSQRWPAGTGGPKDAGSGVGWLQAAAANGCEQLVATRWPALRRS